MHSPATTQLTVQKVASSDLDVCRGVMSRIYGENPSYWPYGLRDDMYNGGLYLVKAANTGDPAGFVGWQEFNEEGKTVGYYSIGILPEYRRQGLAKYAVSKLLAEKSSGVDEVRALIRSSNGPSLKLADTLGVPVEKVASSGMQKEAFKAALKGLWNAGEAVAKHPKTGILGGGVGGAALTDAIMYKDDSWVPGIGDEGWSSVERLGDKHRAVENLISALSFGSIPALSKFLGSPAAGITVGSSIPFAKIMAGDSKSNKIKQLALDKGRLSNQKILTGLLGAGLLGGLGIAGYKAFGPKEEEEQDPLGKIRLTLPTRDPNDNETQVEIPFNASAINLSQTMEGDIGRDFRRRLREESKHRIRRRTPKRVESDAPFLPFI